MSKIIRRWADWVSPCLYPSFWHFGHPVVWLFSKLLSSWVHDSRCSTYTTWDVVPNAWCILTGCKLLAGYWPMIVYLKVGILLPIYYKKRNNLINYRANHLESYKIIFKIFLRSFTSRGKLYQLFLVKTCIFKAFFVFLEFFNFWPSTPWPQLIVQKHTCSRVVIYNPSEAILRLLRRCFFSLVVSCSSLPFWAWRLLKSPFGTSITSFGCN